MECGSGVYSGSGVYGWAAIAAAANCQCQQRSLRTWQDARIYTDGLELTAAHDKNNAATRSVKGSGMRLRGRTPGSRGYAPGLNFVLEEAAVAAWWRAERVRQRTMEAESRSVF